ncbi:hybrid-cluster NAD(P)-dependent oxidoreductase [Rhizobium sp. L1K21]|uniref:hybrid-cluster NAD(P)-dependent oxidoreductase n=1 Tax=Rhizobium sp. L1K21 TaxID=2954933 RepID=UPI002093FF6E|nr:hybrid-cluster NAD(P)-dependent oxidoreductase [Rhizobium sp. L1K21]MCO6186644.1 hybrid-cluster NAD(P)-dependent oxidoreductase [Rhizobium sp. L1K21]
MNAVALTGAVPAALHLDEMKPWNSSRQMLVCLNVADEAPNVKTFTFAVEGGGWFRYLPGQFITLELRAMGGDLHRTYTISSSPSRPYAISITIKAQPNSIGTRWIFDNVHPGSRIRAYGPNGHFTLSRKLASRYLFISAGSGITPMMSMTRWLSDCAPATDITFINSVRTPEEIIFRDELHFMSTHMENLKLGFISETRTRSTPWAGFTGRIDLQKLKILAPDFLKREVFCCGPEPFMNAVSSLLRSEGFDMARYHQESFVVAPAAKTPLMAVDEIIAEAEGALDGHRVEFLSSGTVGTALDGQTVLQTARASGVRIPAACESGLCGTCKVKKRSGEVDIQHNGGISDSDLEDGYILACCSRPLGPVEIEA